RAMVPGDIEVQTHLKHHPSLAQGLVEDATRLDAWAIVIGSAGEGLLGRHSLGTVSNGLLHASHVPIVLAPRGQRHSRVDGICQVTCAIGSEHNVDAVLRFAGRMCVQMHVALRLVSLVSRPHHVLPLREAMAAADGDAPARATEALAKARETVHAAV